MTRGRRLAVATVGVLLILLGVAGTAPGDDATGKQRRAILKAFYADRARSDYSITAVRAEGSYGLVVWSAGSAKRRPRPGETYYFEERGNYQETKDVPRKVKKKLNAPLVFDFAYEGDAHYVQIIHDVDDETGAVSDVIFDAPIAWQTVYRGIKVPLSGVPPSNYFKAAEPNPETTSGVIWDAECAECAVTHLRCTGFTEIPAGSFGNVHSPPGLNDAEFMTLDFVPAELWNMVSMTTEIPDDPDLEPVCGEAFENQPALMEAQLEMPDLLTHNRVMSLDRLRAAKVGQELSFPVGEQGGQPTRNCSSSRKDRCEQYFQDGGWHADLTAVRKK